MNVPDRLQNGSERFYLKKLRNGEGLGTLDA
jgi:hypothetical protein